VLQPRDHVVFEPGLINHSQNIRFVSAAGRGGAYARGASGDGLQAAAPDRLSAPTAGGQGTAPALSEAAGSATPPGGRGERATAAAPGSSRGAGIEIAKIAGTEGTSGPEQTEQCVPQ